MEQDPTAAAPRPLIARAFGPADGGAPEWLVVMLHGVGADGADLIGLAPILAGGMTNALFLAPDGPEPCDMAPMGRQWFSLARRDPGALDAGVRRASVDVAGFVAGELDKAGLGADRLILLGFSQGAMTALHLALRGAEGPAAAVVALSGMLLCAHTLADEIRHRPPVLICHGDADMVVPVSAAGHAGDLLQAAGVPVERHIVAGLGHGVDDRVIAFIQAFLEHVTGAVS